MTLSPSLFQQHLLTWFDAHGRKMLPWQIDKTPYRVWISEIMLQQTQVATVIPYYERFMQQFPTIRDLAKAHQDDVLHLWAGLGYYTRARNLHRAAKMIVDEFNGAFPDTLETIIQLPGIGRSTAGAILSIAFQTPTPILDGNVKRVLSRLHGISNPVDDKKTEAELWTIANNFTPTKRIADYTQAIMDLGATFCTRSQPSCSACPFAKVCIANLEKTVSLIPAKKTKQKIPVRQTTFVIIKNSDAILLVKRPSQGIWGGLYSLPEIADEPSLATLQEFCHRQFRLTVSSFEALPSFRHTFSHYHLDIFPVLVSIGKRPQRVMEAGNQIWYNLLSPEAIGLPKPIQTILRGLT